jgi:DNA polymerase-3 subunit beta
MHVIVSRSALLEVLGAAAGVSATRTPKEILKCVRLTTANGGLLLSATDLEVALRGDVQQVEVKKDGDILVPADKLMQIARESNDETLAIEADDQACHIRGHNSHFEVYGQDPREFPPVPDLEGEPDVEIDADALHTLIERTLFSVAKENTRYAINGVLWEKSGKKLCMVATDGRRLARSIGSAEKTTGDDATMIVPAKTVQALQRVLGNVEGNVGIGFSTNQVVIRAGAYVLSSALVEGHFPQYDDVIPKDSDKRIDLATDEFLSAVRRAALLTNDQSKGVRLSLSTGKLVLSSRAPEQGEATIGMDAGYDGPDLDIGFNPVFLTDALRAIGSPTVQLELKESNRPGVLKVAQQFLYVVMPVSLS